MNLALFSLPVCFLLAAGVLRWSSGDAVSCWAYRLTARASCLCVFLLLLLAVAFSRTHTQFSPLYCWFVSHFIARNRDKLQKAQNELQTAEKRRAEASEKLKKELFIYGKTMNVSTVARRACCCGRTRLQTIRFLETAGRVLCCGPSLAVYSMLFAYLDVPNMLSAQWCVYIEQFRSVPGPRAAKTFLCQRYAVSCWPRCQR